MTLAVLGEAARNFCLKPLRQTWVRLASVFAASSLVCFEMPFLSLNVKVRFFLPFSPS